MCVLKTKKNKKTGALRPTPNVTFFVYTFFFMSPKTYPVNLKSCSV